MGAADLALHLNNLAYLRRVQEDYPSAEALYGEALGPLAELYGRGHATSLMVANNRASVLALMGRTDEALGVLVDNVKAAKAQWPQGHWRVGGAQMALGRALLLRAHRPEEAKEPLLAGGRIYRELLGEDHNWTSFAAVTYRVAQILADASPRPAKPSTLSMRSCWRPMSGKGGSSAPVWFSRSARWRWSSETGASRRTPDGSKPSFRGTAGDGLPGCPAIRRPHPLLAISPVLLVSILGVTAVGLTCRVS